MNAFRNLKTRTKLISSFLVIAVILTFVGLYGLSNMGKLNGNLEVMYDDNLVPVATILRAQADIADIRTAIREAYIYNTSEMQQESSALLADKRRSIEEALLRYKNAYMSEANKKAFEPLEGAFADYYKTIEDAMKLESEGKREEMLALIQGDMKVRVERLTDILNENVDITISDAGVARDEAESMYASSRNITIGAVIGATLLCILFGYMISQIISKPLTQVVTLVSKVAQGDLRETVDYKSRDEIGQLSTAVNDMIQNLRGIVGSITASSHTLAASAQEISASTEEIANGTSSQASAAQAINELFAELSTAIHTVAENTELASELSDQTTVIARDGSEVIRQSMASMDAVSAQMVRLEDDSQRIGDIIEVIEDIADQTNLLALNAAIEAARAGEQGRGFAVVADEVRKLAERSGDATKQIAGIIKGMQENTRLSVKAVGESAELSRQTGDSFQRIAGMVNDAGSKVTEIAAASEEQAAQANSVLLSVESISSASEEAAASSEETAATAQALAKLAEELQSAVEVFKL